MLPVSYVVWGMQGPSGWTRRYNLAGWCLVVRRAFPFGNYRGWARGILPPVGEGLVLVEACGGCSIQTVEVVVSSDD